MRRHPAVIDSAVKYKAVDHPIDLVLMVKFSGRTPAAPGQRIPDTTPDPTRSSSPPVQGTG